MAKKGKVLGSSWLRLRTCGKATKKHGQIVDYGDILSGNLTWLRQNDPFISFTYRSTYRKAWFLILFPYPFKIT